MTRQMTPTVDLNAEFHSTIRKDKQFEYTLSEARAENIPFAIEPPESVTCEYCGQILEPIGCINIWDRYINYWHKVEDCNCDEAIKSMERKKEEEKKKKEKEKIIREQAKIKKKIDRLFEQSGLGERFRQRTFENFQQNKDNFTAYKIARKYTEGFESYKGRGEGLYIAGNVGTGKTHLVSAIANFLINRGVPVICGTLISLFDKVKQSWGKNNINEWEILNLYQGVDLLIIDDLGKEKPSEWSLSRLFSIVNERYEGCKPLIVSSNYDSKTLTERLSISKNDFTAQAIVSRLFEMCTGVKISGQDWRRR